MWTAGWLLTLASLLTACQSAGPAAPAGPATVAGAVADFETDPVVTTEDAADDPVILVGEAGADSWIVGTDKKYGLRVYDFTGRQVVELATGRVNNVDAVRLAANRFLLAASNRTTPAIDLYSADLAAGTIELTRRIAVDLAEPYGLCMAPGDPDIEVFIGDKDGRIERWLIAADLSAALAQTYQLDSQTEGCVVDPVTNTLYVGEENRGIWAIDRDSDTRRLIDATGAGWLVADVEGLDIYRGADQAWLVASSQGDNHYVLYDLASGKPAIRFPVLDNPSNAIDGTQETDGLAVTTAALPGYPRGILVVQDGINTRPAEPQNFKIIDWREVEKLLDNR